MGRNEKELGVLLTIPLEIKGELVFLTDKPQNNLTETLLVAFTL